MLTEVDHDHGLCRALTNGLAVLQKLRLGQPTVPLDDAAIEDLLATLSSVHEERERLDVLFAAPATLSAAGRPRVASPRRIPADNDLIETINNLTTLVCGNRATVNQPALRKIQSTCVTLLEKLQRSARGTSDAEMAI